jgi:hypothetical protein
MTNKKKKFTLDQLLPKAVDMPVVHPQLGEIDLTIKVQGQFTSAVKQKSIETLAWLQNASKETKPEELSRLIQAAEGSAAEVAAAAIIGWSDDDALGGPYTPDYATTLMKRGDMAWLREQINKFVSDQNNFFRKAG